MYPLENISQTEIVSWSLNLDSSQFNIELSADTLKGHIIDSMIQKKIHEIAGWELRSDKVRHH